MTDLVRRSTLALAVLSLLAEAPMHPYRMQRLIRQRHKDKVVNVGQRASLYKTIERLHKAGLVAVRETGRDQNWPERTVYELTDPGREVLVGWMRDALAEPKSEFPEFPAALSFVALLTPDDLSRSLDARVTRLRADVAELEAELAAAPVPRLFVIEDEYRLAIRRAELGFVGSLVDDLRAGRLSWTEEWVRQLAAAADRP